MNKEKLKQLKNKLIALSIAGISITSVGCSKEEKIIEDEPARIVIDEELNRIDEVINYKIENNQAVKKYKPENVFLFYDKETYRVKRYLYQEERCLGIVYETFLYDMDSEELVLYSKYNEVINKDYYEYLVEKNYIITLMDLEGFCEYEKLKDEYSREEIGRLEKEIREGLIKIQKIKTKD